MISASVSVTASHSRGAGRADSCSGPRQLLGASASCSRPPPAARGRRQPLSGGGPRCQLLRPPPAAWGRRQLLRASASRLGPADSFLGPLLAAQGWGLCPAAQGLCQPLGACCQLLGSSASHSGLGPPPAASCSRPLPAAWGRRHPLSGVGRRFQLLRAPASRLGLAPTAQGLRQLFGASAICSGPAPAAQGSR
jgi:hypothetical protein